MDFPGLWVGSAGTIWAAVPVSMLPRTYTPRPPRRRARGAVPALVGIIAALGFSVPERVYAADEDYPLPPVPTLHEAAWAVEIDFDLVFPIVRTGICPNGTGCVGGNGAGASLWAERRFARGFGVGLGYDLWLIDGSGVFDTTVVQSFALGGRYVALADRAVHPTFGLSLGLLLLGDTFVVATYGGFLDLRVGIEVEISETVAFVSALGVRLVTTAAFTTKADGVARSQGFEADAVLGAQVGLLFLL